MHMKQISGPVHTGHMQLYGMPMVGFGMVATYLTLPAIGTQLKTVNTSISIENSLFSILTHHHLLESA